MTNQTRSAFVVRPNTANLFTPREPGEFEFTGDGDIDGQPYKVTVTSCNTRVSEKGFHYSARRVTFTDVDTGRNFVFKGSVFDKRIDGETGDRKTLHPKAPSWSGKLNGPKPSEKSVPIIKEVSIWEKTDKNGNIYFSCSVRNEGERSSGSSSGAIPAQFSEDQFASNPFE